jgi:hypothetical protein
VAVVDTVQGISDHDGIVLEVEWEESSWELQGERVVPVYNRTNVLGLQTFLRDKFAVYTRRQSNRTYRAKNQTQ